VKKQLAIVIVLNLLIISTISAESTGTEPNYQWPASIFPTDQPLGSVKSITETAYTMADDNGHREFKYKLILRYSEEQQLLSEEYYGHDNSPGNRIDYSYENGWLVLKTQSHPEILNPDREIFTLSDDGRILETEKIFSKGNYGWKFRNSYDNNGKIILTSKYDRYWKWKLVYSRMFEYDDNGRMSATEGFGMQSELLWRDEHFYDASGLLLESVKYNPDEELVVRILNEYNDERDLTRREFFDVNGRAYAVYSYGWNYDEKGNWVSKVIGREIKGSSSAYLVPDSMISREIEYYE